jgi:hypothetical protein
LTPIEKVNKQHDYTLQLFKDRIDRLKDFKEEISRDLLGLHKYAEEIKQKFRKFEASEDS